MWRPSLWRKRSETSIFSSQSTTTSSESLNKPPAPRGPRAVSRSTLSEVLKNNPFRSGSKDALPEKEPSKREEPIKALNKDLKVIANIYPDVQLDVLREILCRFDGDSRLQVSIEQLFRHKSEWARGRLLTPPRDSDDELPQDELFRNQEYTEGCKRTLYAEFRLLNKSAVDAVLAEVNNSYTKARPVLQEISAKTWRATLTSFFRKRRATEEPPLFLVERQRNGDYRLFSTGNKELDAELYDLYLYQARSLQTTEQEEADFEAATKLNQAIAEEEGSLFECQCCYAEVAFEQIITCTEEAHVMCVGCVRRSLAESVFGQGWNRSVSIPYATLNCFVVSSTAECQGRIPPDVLRQAITAMHSGTEIWSKFEQRLATDSLTKSGLSLQHCPFCTYAEVHENQNLQSVLKIKWRLRRTLSTVTAVVVISVLWSVLFLPVILAFSCLLVLFSSSIPRPSFDLALMNISGRQRTSKFTCKSPTCGKKSCTTCHKQWHDPHVCHKPLILSLRNAVEAARTAALKRVCPRCGTGFVKDSGCNKLVCVCGYAMCYICRKNIGKVPSAVGAVGGAAQMRIAANWPLNLGLVGVNHDQAAMAEEEELVAAGEGYRHFCPHFRLVPGQKCTECDKCDLYKTEDEDAIVRHAGEVAEREWREKYEKEMTVRVAGTQPELAGLENALDGIDDGDDDYLWALGKRWERVFWKVSSDMRSGRLGPQGILDWIVDRFVIVEDERT